MGSPNERLRGGVESGTRWISQNDPLSNIYRAGALTYTQLQLPNVEDINHFSPLYRRVQIIPIEELVPSTLLWLHRKKDGETRFIVHAVQRACRNSVAASRFHQLEPGLDWKVWCLHWTKRNLYSWNWFRARREHFLRDSYRRVVILSFRL